MPTVDSTQAPGFQATATVGVGLAFSKQEAIMMPMSVGPGFRKAATYEPEAAVDVGLEYLRLGENAGRVGFRGGFAERTLATSSTSAGVATQVAMPVTLWSNERSPRAPTDFISLGPALDAALFPILGPRGTFGFGVAFEWTRLGSLFLP